MVCLGFEPGAAGWKARTNPLSYGGTPKQIVLLWLDGFAEYTLTCVIIFVRLFTII